MPRPGRIRPDEESMQQQRNLGQKETTTDFLTPVRPIQRISHYIKLPSTFQGSFFRKTNHQIKRFILNKSKQHLRSEIAIHYGKQREFNLIIQTEYPAMIEQIRIHTYLAYNTASKHHEERLRKKLTKLRRETEPDKMENRQRSENQRHALTPPDKSDLVTDLTNSITSEEHHLLAKGPKFGLASEINEKTLVDMNIGFYRIANQIRWKSQSLSSNQHPNICYHISTI